MKIGPNLEQSQKITLTYSMKQSLQLLQLSAQDLQEYLEKAALDNPILNVDVTAENVSLANAIKNIDIQDRRETLDFSWWNKPNKDENNDFINCFSKEKSFTEYLKDQINEMKHINKDTEKFCLYLIDCLNSAGYLDCSLEELATESGINLFDMENALSIIQTLEPHGVGARNLEECLLLQLALTENFTENYIRTIKFGLPLLAKKDFKGLSKMLHMTIDETKQIAKTILNLNPIPSRGFSSDEINGYIQPEATILNENGNLVIEMNDRCFPKITLDDTYCAMLNDPQYKDAKKYLQEKMADAKNIISGLKKRNDTLFHLICLLVEMQKEFFVNNKDIRPMNMEQIADAMEVNISTISRAVSGKYIQFHGKVFPIRSLFTTALVINDKETTSSEAVKRIIKKIISTENKKEPLSDDKLREVLLGIQINISRRTIAKYRNELKIPNTSERREI